ncbi:DMT family transporter [Pseudomonas eucalypticola]|uniref:DMT family transporter n=1 Tax=Pseudomonas eucalypticola TaxID=2599595 RepID=A0A7D5HQI5_9PSED|nr:DMT family transporter [Pseudomonas eucalypticola]QKZ06128.1 DMT family transporter [Pseudomonas eucalypticola]
MCVSYWLPTNRNATDANCTIRLLLSYFAAARLGAARQTGDGADWRGDLLIFGCVLSWVAYSLFGKSVVKEIGALHTVTYSIWAGAAMLTITAIAKGQFSLDLVRALPANELLSLTYLGAVGSALAYIWFYNGIQVIGANRAGVFIALNPLTAVLLGWGLLDEHISVYTAMGGALVIGGIVVCNKPVSSTETTWFRSGFFVRH